MFTRGNDPPLLIAGLGNERLRDDGAGIHAVRELAKAPPRGVEIAEVGTAVLHAHYILEWATRILVIDAMKAGGEPGTIYLLGGRDLERRRQMTSLHELSLLGVLRFLPEENTPDLVVLGIEPAVIDYGKELSSEVARAVPKVVEAARHIARLWQTAPDSPRLERFAHCW
jgi:hydrogenase maturation protease